MREENIVRKMAALGTEGRLTMGRKVEGQQGPDRHTGSVGLKRANIGNTKNYKPLFTISLITK